MARRAISNNQQEKKMKKRVAFVWVVLSLVFLAAGCGGHQ